MLFNLRIFINMMEMLMHAVFNHREVFEHSKGFTFNLLGVCDFLKGLQKQVTFHTDGDCQKIVIVRLLTYFAIFFFIMHFPE
jgi:hypothetical protein